MSHPLPLSRRAQQRTRDAITKLVDMAGGPHAFAESHGLGTRSVLRMMHGDKLPPIGLARELVAMLDALPFDIALQHTRNHLAAFVANREAAISAAQADAAHPHAAQR